MHCTLNKLKYVNVHIIMYLWCTYHEPIYITLILCAFICACIIKVKDMHIHDVYNCVPMYTLYLYSQTSVLAATLAGGKDFVAMTRRDATSTAPVPASTQLGKQQLGAICRTPPSSSSSPRPTQRWPWPVPAPATAPRWPTSACKIKAVCRFMAKSLQTHCLYLCTLCTHMEIPCREQC